MTPSAPDVARLAEAIRHVVALLAAGRPGGAHRRLGEAVPCQPPHHTTPPMPGRRKPGACPRPDGTRRGHGGAGRIRALGAE
jgi:hypothetical protein